MSRIDLGAYKAVLAVKSAYRFDAGTFLMRLFQYTTTIGTISMLTLAGASAFEATTVSSVLAAFTFVVSPQVSRQIDRYGQDAVVPIAAAIGLAGFALMVCVVQFAFPFWLNYVAALLASFLPSAPALARTRWAYLVETRCMGKDTPMLKSTYAFEGILEDIAFMIGPAVSIAVAAATVPVGGIVLGMVVYAVGTAVLLSSKDTAPDQEYLAARAERANTQKRSALFAYPMVFVLFVVMVLVGCIYGGFDTSAISYSESIDMPVLASAVFAIESVFSVVVSTLFGMIRLPGSLSRQFAVFTALFGLLYVLLAFIATPVSFVVIASVAALSYAPLLITANVVCEAAVPEENLTEAMAWMNSGTSVGMVVGPVSAGALIDASGPLVGFDLCTVFALGLIVVAFVTIPVVRKSLRR
ncbi:MAG: MFS transporter [Eggerthellaceae bacterium]|nr:MFS transporter [Eggerthellaceae bacterium]